LRAVQPAPPRPELLSGPTEGVPPELIAVFEAICAARTPRLALN
jgi:hypothetical protein